MDETKGVEKLQYRWAALMEILRTSFGNKLGLEGILMLVGIREVGIGPREFSKEEKTDLMHVAICAIFEKDGYYKLVGSDQDGWPHWEELKPLPFTDIFSQEILLKSQIIDYFEDVYEI